MATVGATRTGRLAAKKKGTAKADQPRPLATPQRFAALKASGKPFKGVVRER